MVYKQHKGSSGTISNKEMKVIEQINEILPLIEISITNVKEGKKVDGNENQLVKIRYELGEMSKILNPKEYLPGFGHAIADSWDADSVLGNSLLDIIDNYKKLQ